MGDARLEDDRQAVRGNKASTSAAPDHGVSHAERQVDDLCIVLAPLTR